MVTDCLENKSVYSQMTSTEPPLLLAEEKRFVLVAVRKLAFRQKLADCVLQKLWTPDGKHTFLSITSNKCYCSGLSLRYSLTKSNLTCF